MIKGLYIRDHELKFYILSVNRMGYTGTYRDVGLTKMDIIVILKSIANKSLLFDQGLVTRNYQSIFNYQDDLMQFLNSYNPKSYFNDYCNERISEFERKLRQRLLTVEEMQKDEQVSFPRKEMTAREKYKSKDSTFSFKTKTKQNEDELPLEETKSRNSPDSVQIPENSLTKIVSAPPKLIENKSKDAVNFKDPRFYKQGQKPPYFQHPEGFKGKYESPKKEIQKDAKVTRSPSSSSSTSSNSPQKVRRVRRDSGDKKDASSQSETKKKQKSRRNSTSSSGESSSSNKSR